MSSFRFRRAIVRRPAASYHLGITSADSGEGDFLRFERQHRAYVDALSESGLDVQVLEALDDYPDAQFVEDVAVIVPDAVVITRPGAPSRRGETDYIEEALASYGEVLRIEAPGTLDGGDVLVMGKRCFIGCSVRTNADGASQLARILKSRGYPCTVIVIASGLHLKSSVNAVDDETVVATGLMADHDAFRSFRRVLIDDEEAYAANVLRVNDRLLVPDGYPKSLDRIAELGLDVEIVGLETSEARRMDGGLTCLSLRF